MMTGSSIFIWFLKAFTQITIHVISSYVSKLKIKQACGYDNEEL